MYQWCGIFAFQICRTCIVTCTARVASCDAHSRRSLTINVRVEYVTRHRRKLRTSSRNCWMGLNGGGLIHQKRSLSLSLFLNNVAHCAPATSRCDRCPFARALHFSVASANASQTARWAHEVAAKLSSSMSCRAKVYSRVGDESPIIGLFDN